MRFKEYLAENINLSPVEDFLSSKHNITNG